MRFAILYFTGSKDFNTAQRRHAIKMGYSLNDKYISRLPEKSKKQTKETKKKETVKAQEFKPDHDNTVSLSAETASNLLPRWLDRSRRVDENSHLPHDQQWVP